MTIKSTPKQLTNILVGLVLFFLATTIYAAELNQPLRCNGKDDTQILADAIIAAKGQPIVIANGQTCAATDITIPNLRIDQGGLLKPLTGHTIRLSGLLATGRSQIFINALAGEGTVVLSSEKSSIAYPQWWGAVGRPAADETKDDTKAIAAAFNSGARKIEIPDGHYVISAAAKQPGQTKTGLNLVSNIEIEMGSNTYLHAAKNSSDDYNIIAGWKVSNVIIRGGNLVGDNITNARTPESNPSGYGLALFGVSNVWVYNVTARDMLADGFFIAYDDEVGPHPESEGVHLINCNGYKNYRQGISIVGAKNSSIEGGTYSGTKGSSPQAGIDIEPNANIHGSGKGSEVTDFTIKGVTLKDNAGCGILIVGQNGPVAQVKVFENQVYSNAEEGILVMRGTSSQIHDNTISRNSRNGISVYHSSFIEVKSNASSQNNQNGIIVHNPDGEPTQHITVSGNTTEQNQGDGIVVAGSPGKTISDVIISGNTSAGNGKHGIALNFGTNVSVEDNRVTANSQLADGASDNIYVSNSERCSILRNLVRRGEGARQPGYGVNLVSGKNLVVRDNDLVQAGRTEALKTAAPGSSILGNKLQETTPGPHRKPDTD